MSRMPLQRPAGALVFLAMVLLLVALFVPGWLLSREAASMRAWLDHTYDVIRTANELDLAIHDAETGQRGFLLTGDPDYLGSYDTAQERTRQGQDRLRALTADNPAQLVRLEHLAPLLRGKLDELAETVALRRRGEAEAALSVVRTGQGRALMLQIGAALDAIRGEEARLLEERRKGSRETERLSRMLTVSGTGLAAALLAVAGVMLARARRRRFVAEAAQRSLAGDMEAAIGSISQGLAIFGPDLALRHWNPCFATLLDFPKEVLRPGTGYGTLSRYLADAGSPLLESPEELRLGLEDGWQQGAVTYDRSRASDGRQFEVRRAAMPGGGFVLTVTDLTDRLRQEAAARDGQRLQAMGQLTGGIAHDFNNLLTVVLGNLEMVKARLPADSPLLVRIDRAIWGGRRGASLTQQLLAFARRQPLAPMAIDLSAMLPTLTGLLRRTLGEHIEVRLVEAAGLWPVMADSTQLETALLNLALNARDAMPEGGQLTIEAVNKVLDRRYAESRSEVSPGDYVMLAVSDTGHGMAPEVLARVFEPFFTTKEPGKGTGLGLAMVFGFVKQSGGHASVYSEPGEGTTVKLYLPRATRLQPAVPRPVAPLVLPRGNATVLVVEDEPRVREVAVETLRELGYRVLEAGDGPGALRLAEAEPRLDLVLADIVLPGGMKGNAVAEALVARFPGLRVLYMSGYTENAIVHHGRLDDGVHLLGKPFSREALARRVAEVLAAPATAVGGATSAPG